jgi:hypothetical protein
MPPAKFKEELPVINTSEQLARFIMALLDPMAENAQFPVIITPSKSPAVVGDISMAHPVLLTGLNWLPVIRILNHLELVPVLPLMPAPE